MSDENSSDYSSAESSENDQVLLRTYVDKGIMTTSEHQEKEAKLREVRECLERCRNGIGYTLKQSVFCQLLKDYRKMGDNRELLDVLQEYDINVLQDGFFDIFDESSVCSSDNEDENSHVYPDIVQQVTTKMMCTATGRPQADHLSMGVSRPKNCIKFLDFCIHWMGSDSDLTRQAANCVLQVLHTMANNGLIDFIHDQHVESLIAKVENLIEPDSLFYILKAKLNAEKHANDDSKLKEASKMVKKALGFPNLELRIRYECTALAADIEKLQKLGTTQSSRTATPEGDGNQASGKRKKKKRKAGPKDATTEEEQVTSVHSPEASTSHEDGVLGLSEISDTAKKAFDNISLAKFMEECNLVPFDISIIDNFLKRKDLSVLSETDLPLLEALWSVIESQSWMHNRWKLSNISVEEFKRRISQRLHPDETQPETLQTLSVIADEYSLKIIVCSVLTPLIPPLKVLPSKTGHTHTLHLLHTRQKRFLGLIGTGKDHHLPDVTTASAGLNAQPQAAKGPTAVQSVFNKVSRLEQRVDEIKLEGRDHPKNFYRMLTRTELEEKYRLQPHKYRICILHLKGPHEGVAEPLDNRSHSPEDSILLRGRKSCGMAFDGDEVVVEVFMKNGKIESGKVIGVWNSSVRPVNQVFFCKVSKDQTNLMRPICGTVPKIHVNNKAAVEKYKETELPDATELLMFHSQEGSATHREETRASGKFANYSMVSVFKMDVKNGEPNFSQGVCRKVHPLTCTDIFVVVYQRWNPKFLYPFGHIIGVLGSELSAQDEASVRRILCGLPHPHDSASRSSAEAKRLCSKRNSKIDLTGRKDFRALRTFTIDNSKNEGLDNAISFSENGAIRQITVHISDVSHFVAPNSDLDREARKRIFTVSGHRIGEPVHLLPPALSRKLSFEVGQDRLCLSVVLRFEKTKENEMRLLPAKENEILASVVKLDKRIVPTNVWEAINKDDVSPDDWLVSDLQNILKCALKMRQNRLKEMALTQEHCIRDLDKLGVQFPSDVILEELMVEVNRRIAQFLNKSYRGPSIRRRHLKPGDSKIEEWMKLHKNIIPHSSTLKYGIQCLKQDAQIHPQSQHPVVINSDIKQRLEVAIQNRDFDYAFYLLSCERLHPRIFLAIKAFSALSRLAEYDVCSPELAPQARRNPNLSHHGLDLDAYTHFTSPLHRYVDIVIHRLVHAALRSEREPKYSEKDLKSIVADCNHRIAQLRRYNRLMSLFKLYRSTAKKPLSIPCVISAVTSSGIRLDHHYLKGTTEDCRSLPYAKMDLNKTPKFETDSDGIVVSLDCEFKRRLFIFDPKVCDSHPHRRWPFSETDYSLRNFENHYKLVRLRRECKNLSNVLSRSAEDRIAFFKSLELEPQFHLPTENTCSDVTAEVCKPDSAPPKHQKRTRRFVLDTAVTFSTHLRSSDSLRCQFHAPPMQSKLRSAKLSFVQFSPSFGICVEHQDDPVRCFGGVEVEAIPDKPQFDSVTNYATSWLALVRMEAISESLGDHNSFHIRDMPVTWLRSADGSKLAGVFKMDPNFCQNQYRQISMASQGVLADCHQEQSMYLQYVCVKVPLKDYVWIGHGGVKFRCEMTASTTVVFFDIRHQSNPFPEEIVKEKKYANIEFVNKTFPIRYQERALKLLPTVPDDCLAEAMALGDFDRQVGTPLPDVLDQNQRLRSSEFDQACNREQRRAITNAFAWAISLIWGPPGTGKSHTGVQIAFWFAMHNRRIQPLPEDSDESGSDEAIAQIEHNSRNQQTDSDDGFERVKGRRRRTRVEHFNGVTPARSPYPASDLDDCDVVTLEVWILQEPESVPLTSRRRQVLYCGPSNTCINGVAERLLLKAPEGISVVRVFSRQVERKNFPLPGIRHSGTQFDSEVEVPQNLRDISLHFLIRKKDRPFAACLLKYDDLFQRAQKYLDGEGRPLVIKFSDEKDDDTPALQQADKNHKFLANLRRAVKMYHNIVTAAKAIELRNYDIVLCTTVVSASSVIQHHCRFCQMIIDEAGMCTEPETLVPLTPAETFSASAETEHAVVIGDHKQLRPIISDQVAGELGLLRSMMERHWFANKDSGNRMMLKDQYRMHPTICEFPSREIYSKELKTVDSPSWKFMGGETCDSLEQEAALRKNGNYDILRDLWPTSKTDPALKERVVFIHVEGEEKSLMMSSKEGNENSRSNSKEAEVVSLLYKKMQQEFTPHRRALSSIAVLSQYQSQVHLIRENLGKRFGPTQDLGKPKSRKMKTVGELFRDKEDKFRQPPMPYVTSVIRSQGSEFDYVILSTVRSLPMHDIELRPTPGWEHKYLGFITDTNQINVALTRARKGLIIVGNGNLLVVHHFWKGLIADLRTRGCYFERPNNFFQPSSRS